MSFRFVLPVVLAGLVLGTAAGCKDSKSNVANPKVGEGAPQNFKERPAPGNPGGGGPAKGAGNAPGAN